MEPSPIGFQPLTFAEETFLLSLRKTETNSFHRANSVFHYAAACIFELAALESITFVNKYSSKNIAYLHVKSYEETYDPLLNSILESMRIKHSHLGKVKPLRYWIEKISTDKLVFGFKNLIKKSLIEKGMLLDAVKHRVRTTEYILTANGNEIRESIIQKIRKTFNESFCRKKYFNIFQNKYESQFDTKFKLHLEPEELEESKILFWILYLGNSAYLASIISPQTVKSKDPSLKLIQKQLNDMTTNLVKFRQDMINFYTTESKPKASMSVIYPLFYLPHFIVNDPCSSVVSHSHNTGAESGILVAEVGVAILSCLAT